jgi:3'-phosphoadenosine 5'-phosphosulfate (PAPS) 3'-phosphatase
VSRAAFIRAHCFAVFLGLLHRGVPQIFLPAPLCPLCRPLFKYGQSRVYLAWEKYHKSELSPQHKANPNLWAIKAEMHAEKSDTVKRFFILLFHLK